MKRTRIFLLLIFSVLVVESKCANILGVFPTKLSSHYFIFKSILMELAGRGHNITVLNTFPTHRLHKNFTDIDIGQCCSIRSSSMNELHHHGTKFTDIFLLAASSIAYTKRIFECDPIKKFLNANNSYDLVITELFITDISLGFADKFQVPHITFCAGPIYPWGADRMGNPSNPSYMPYNHLDEEFDAFHSTFYQRLYNTLGHLSAQIVYYSIHYCYGTENMARKLFGSESLKLDELTKKTSLILSYSHFSINGPLVHVPGVIEIAGVQINEARVLPKDIQNFIDESEHGVIYFCMGSLIQMETMPELKRIAFLEAFSKLPQRVIWKWNGNLSGKTDKIYISEWLPQRDILAHPKVKLFIAHGGALGLNEATHEGVPVLGIPMFADQLINLGKLRAYGAAEILPYADINNDTVLAKIFQVLQPEYSINMKKLSEIYKDRPMSAMNTSIYWIEYVIRHRGAPHLRSAAVDLPLYQYLLLDVIVFLLVVLLSVIFSIYYILKRLILYFFTRNKSHHNSKKEK